MMEKYPFKKNQAIVEDIIEELSENAVLKKFFIEHDITHATIENHLNSLMTYSKEAPLCDDCPGLDACKQDALGHQPVLNYNNDIIRLTYQPCPYYKQFENRERINSKIQTMHMPKMIMQANLDDFHMNTVERKNLYKKVMHIIQQTKLNEKTKGLYLTGRYQIGKTYTLAALANYFATIHKTVIIGYYPDMVREIKSSIKTGDLESIIHNLKTVDVLMLDDIGGEASSQWIRDEVLGPILQHRLLDQKLTFFSSNIPLKELSKSLTENDQKADLIKAYRISERIKALSDEFIM